MTQVFYLYKNEPKILTWLSKMPEGLPEMECRGDGGGGGGGGMVGREVDVYNPEILKHIIE